MQAVVTTGGAGSLGRKALPGETAPGMKITEAPATPRFSKIVLDL